MSSGYIILLKAVPCPLPSCCNYVTAGIQAQGSLTGLPSLQFEKACWCVRDSSQHPNPGDGDSAPAGDGPEDTARLGPQRWRVSCPQPACGPCSPRAWFLEDPGAGEGQSDGACSRRGMHCPIRHTHSCARFPLPSLVSLSLASGLPPPAAHAVHCTIARGAGHVACEVNGTPGAGQQWPCSQQAGSEPGPFCSWWWKLMLRDSQ